MRFEAKTEADAVEQAARALGRPTADVSYRVIRDEKSFWGGRIVEIEVEPPAGAAPAASEASDTAIAVQQTALDQPPAALEREEKATAADRSRRS
ncbi:MAG TPA: Jag N-terminal domain-containing protein, partial [Thermoanaerobaculia bacterium]|nr:Jag N-terminal domain-containing protein [Thermoanaerobaculia bacterium]